MDKKANFKSWMVEHKRELIFTGTAVAAVVIGAVIYSKIELSSLIEIANDEPIEVPNVFEPTSQSTKIIEIKSHLRNLPEGYHPSVEKVAEATSAGIKLQLNQTYVSSYSRSCAV